MNSSTSVGNGFTLRYTGNGWLFPFGLADKQVASPQAVSVPWVSPQAQGWGLWTVAIH